VRKFNEFHPEKFRENSDKSPKIFGEISTSEKISIKFTAVHWRRHQENSPKNQPSAAYLLLVFL